MSPPGGNLVDGLPPASSRKHLLLNELCPQVVLQVGMELVHLSGRCIGTLTGSRSASAAGRIPLLDAALARLDVWKSLSFSAEGYHYAMATFVDNLLSTGSSPENATAILDDCEAYLQRHWQLSFGADSREFIVCRGYPHPIQVHERWPQKASMRCLGHWLEDDAGISSCFQNCARNMWRGFFGNLSAGLLASPEHTKLRFLNSCTSSIPSFRWARWPYQDSYAARLDSQQRHMIAVLMQMRPRPAEPFEVFAHRRHISCGKLASKHGKWSQHWAQSLRKWNFHVARRHDLHSWSGPILDWHGESWITRQRLLASSGHESRTRTRIGRGKVHRRWEESLSKAVLIPNPPRRK